MTVHGPNQGERRVADPWDPAQYEQFAAERSAPFFDLLDLVRPIPGGRAADLGCGTGALTAELHRRVQAAFTLGVDSSAAMLERARALSGGGLSFARGDIAGFGSPGRPAGARGGTRGDTGTLRRPGEPGGEGRWDLIFSNAAMQWVPDHPRLLEGLAATLAAGGQLAVQVPANHDHPSHLVAAELAAEEPFSRATGGYRRVNPVQAPERYAELLELLGFAEQHVRLQIYPHHLAGPEQVIEWARGTLLTDYQRRMPPELFERFLATYRERLLPRLDQRRPYFYPFKRILLWAAGPADRAAPWS
jgi:trans-aconitate 2-methyltransferase